jgi:hypothetical protein
MHIVVGLIALVACVAAVAIAFAFRKRKPSPKKAGATQSHSCGAIDPVMDPVYNMKEIVKQSILLEEHINQERKRCKDCITKHFLHIVGLAEEAVSLDPDTPIYREMAGRYAVIFAAWRENHDDTEVPKSLRAARKVLMQKYFMTAGEGVCSGP